MELNDTIAAICTAPGRSGLAVLRVSGPDALAIADRVFRGNTPLASAASHTLHHGWAWMPGAADQNGGSPSDRGEPDRLDEVVAALFKAPRSYTGEDVVEISCHGGRFSAERVRDALIQTGARLAGPGEFTLRAFLNGRIDLTQAEAVADLIHAETAGAHRIALAQLAGSLSHKLELISDRMTDALAEVEARVDFAEDVGGIEVPQHVVALIEDVRGELAAMLAGAAWGRARREGFRLPLAGRPNVGKSSVFNALVGDARAIVATVPGTTRDRVSESIEIEGVVVTLSDTAGLRETEDSVEAIGVQRTRETLEASDAVLWVVDGSVPLGHEDRATATALAGKRVLVALNKRDLGRVVRTDEVEGLLEAAASRAAVELSATRGDGIDALQGAIAALIGVRSTGTCDGASAVAHAVPAHDAAWVDGDGKHRLPAPAADSAIALSNTRHIDAIRRAQEALDRAAAVAAAGDPGELVAIELRDSLDALGEVTGRRVDDEVLDRIFGKFCIGK